MSRLKIAFDFSNLHILESYLVEAYRGALLFAMENDWEVVYRDCYFGPSYSAYDALKGLGVDGVLFDYLCPKDAQKVKETGLAAVNLGGLSYDGQFAAVHQNDERIGQLGARHFLERFYTNLAFFGSAKENSMKRQEGFLSIAEEAKIKVESFEGQFSSSIYFSYTDWRGNFLNIKEFKTWLKSLAKPIGIMCHHDSLAFILSKCCQNLGYKVPEDIAIVGVQEFPLLLDSPLKTLSCVDHNAQACGYQAAALLDKIIKGTEKDQKQIYVSPKGVIQRESTDFVAISHPAISRAHEFIKKYFTDAITVDDVAEAAGVSRASLNRHYRQIMKRSVANEIREYRLERASALLIDSHLNLKEIALLCGFTDASHFSNLFVKKYGQRPGQWRIKKD